MGILSAIFGSNDNNHDNHDQQGDYSKALEDEYLHRRGQMLREEMSDADWEKLNRRCTDIQQQLRNRGRK